MINHEKPPQRLINNTTPSSETQKMQKTLTVDKVKTETVIDNLYITQCKKTTSKTVNTPSGTLLSDDVQTRKSHAYSHKEKFNPHDMTT